MLSLNLCVAGVGETALCSLNWLPLWTLHGALHVSAVSLLLLKWWENNVLQFDCNCFDEVRLKTWKGVGYSWLDDKCQDAQTKQTNNEPGEDVHMPHSPCDRSQCSVVVCHLYFISQVVCSTVKSTAFSSIQD